MEPRFGHDFSRVRVHTDGTAGQSAAAIGADAYTAGRHIAFAPGRYSPLAGSGRALLAHELTHVVQQAGSRAADGGPIEVANAADEHEQTASAVARTVDAGGAAPPIPAVPAAAQRQVARAVHSASVDFGDPNLCYLPTGNRRSSDPSHIIAVFDAVLNVDAKGEVTSTTTIRDKVPGSGTSWAGSDAIRFGLSQGGHTGGYGKATNDPGTAGFTEYKLTWGKTASGNIDYDVFNYIKFVTDENDPSQQYTFAEIKYSPRVTRSGGTVIDRSPAPVIRHDICDHLAPSPNPNPPAAPRQTPGGGRK